MPYRGVFPAVMYGLATILFITLTFSLILSFVLSFTSYTEHSVSWLILIVAFFAMFFGGFISGAKAKKKGWIIGILTALSFSFLTFLIQYLGYDSGFTQEQYLYHAGYLLAATFGAILGVNFTK